MANGMNASYGVGPGLTSSDSPFVQLEKAVTDSRELSDEARSRLLFPLRPHPPAAQISVVPAQGFTQQVRSVASIRQALGTAEVVQQQRLIVGRGAFLDDKVGALSRRESAQVGEALLGHNHLDIVLRVVHMRGHGYDRRDGSLLRRRWRHEDGQVSVAREVAGAANAVLDARSHDVRGVDVAVD